MKTVFPGWASHLFKERSPESRFLKAPFCCVCVARWQRGFFYNDDVTALVTSLPYDNPSQTQLLQDAHAHIKCSRVFCRSSVFVWTAENDSGRYVTCGRLFGKGRWKTPRSNKNGYVWTRLQYSQFYSVNHSSQGAKRQKRGLSRANSASLARCERNRLSALQQTNSFWPAAPDLSFESRVLRTKPKKYGLFCVDGPLVHRARTKRRKRVQFSRAIFSRKLLLSLALNGLRKQRNWS